MHEQSVVGRHDNISLLGTYKEPVDSHEKHLDVTDEATVGGSRNEQLFDETQEHPVVDSHEKSIEGTREEIGGETFEEPAGGTRGADQPSADGEPVSGCQDEPLNNDNHEATVTGPISESSSHHAQESPSQPQPNPPRRRGKPKYKRLIEFDSLRPIL